MIAAMLIFTLTQQLHCFYYFTTVHIAFKTIQKEKKRAPVCKICANLLSTQIDFKAKLKTITSCEILTHFYYIPGYYL